MNLIANIEGQDVTWDGQRIRFMGCGRIDNDGSGPKNGDPCHQSDTSLHASGKALNAEFDRFCVVPPQIIRGVGPIVLGCQAYVTYKGRRVRAVVGDIGPKTRIGEISTSLARDLGINPNPNTGGVDTPDLEFEILPGVPAMTSNATYTLQAS